MAPSPSPSQSAAPSTAFSPLGPPRPAPAEDTVPPEEVLEHYLAGLSLQDSQDYEAAAREFESALAAGGTDPDIRLALAACYLRLNDPSRAEDVARDGLRAHDGRERQFHELIGGIRMGEGRWEDATRELEAARTADPSSFGVHYSLGMLYRKADRDSDAVTEFREAARRLPGQPEAAYQLATELEELGDLRGAADLYTGMIAADSAAIAPRAGLARIAIRTGDSTLAIARYEEAIRIDPGNPPLLADYFRLKLAMLGPSDDPAPVVDAGRRALDAAPDDGEIALPLAGLIAARGDLVAAREILDKVPAESPQSPAVHLMRGRLWYGSGDRAAALRDFEEAHALAPDWPRALAPLALILLETGNTARADSILQTALSAMPDSSDVVFLAGMARSRLGRYEEAADLFRRTLRLDPTDKRATFELAVALEKLGRIDDAARAFEDLLAQDPKNALAANYLGYMLADRGIRLEEAERRIRDAVAMEPDNGFYVDSLGWVRYRRGDLAGATELLERAAQLVESAEVHAHLAEVYEKRNMPEQARASWEQALALDPENRAWRERLQSLSH